MLLYMTGARFDVRKEAESKPGPGAYDELNRYNFVAQVLLYCCFSAALLRLYYVHVYVCILRVTSLIAVTLFCCQCAALLLLYCCFTIYMLLYCCFTAALLYICELYDELNR
jgi:hypothetical protein